LVSRVRECLAGGNHPDVSDVARDSASIWELRRTLRKLPRERRKDVMSSIREGRAVRDARDAPLASAWAERLSALARRSPWWLLPLERPRGWRAWLWVVHLLWVVAAIAYADDLIWSSLGGAWKWIFLGLLLYTAIAMPFTMRQAVAGLLERTRSTQTQQRTGRSGGRSLIRR
jgi:hypothetical protein